MTRLTLPPLRHLVQTYCLEGTPFQLILIRWRLAFQRRRDFRFEWEILLPLVVPLSHTTHRRAIFFRTS